MKKSYFVSLGALVLLGVAFATFYAVPSLSCMAFEAQCPVASLASEEKIYLDVREDEEWSAGHVKGALHLKMGDIFAGNYQEIPQDQPVYIYCRSGRRAGEVIRFLEEKGFKNLINAGGLRDLEGIEIVEGE